jgi:hypothetical protein
MIGFMTFLIPTAKDLPMNDSNVEAARVLVGVFIITITSAVLLNHCWIITGFGIFINIMSTMVYFTVVLRYPPLPIIV